MKCVISMICILFISITAQSQAYLGWTTKTVNLREGPGTDYEILRSLKGGSQIFVLSNIPDKEFYSIIDIDTNTYGYVHKSFVKLGERVTEGKGLFSHEGKSSGYNPEIEIYNDTSKELTLNLNNIRYSFYPRETKTIEIAAGNYSYIASAPGVQPYIGKDDLDDGQKYSWKFYIVTSRY